jgi:YHS domain-containing protein
MRNKLLSVLFLVIAVGLTAWAAGQTQASKTAIDPVCGMSVVKDGAKWTYDYKGTTYYFCSESCKTSFAKEPEKYLAKAEEAKPEEQAAMGRMMGQGMMQGRSGMNGEMTPPNQGKMGQGMMQGHPMMNAGPGRMGRMGRMGMGMRPGMRMSMRRPMMGGMMGGMFGFGPMMMAGVDHKVENTKDGVVITLSSKDPETVKMIQDRLARMLEMEKMMKERLAGMKESAPEAKKK